MRTIFYFRLLLIFGLIACVWACQKQLQDVSSSEPLTIGEARGWYEAQDKTARGAGNDENVWARAKPNWNLSYSEVSKKNGNLVRVPLNHDPIHWLYKVKDKQSGKERTTTMVLPKMQLLFFKNAKKQTEARIVQFIPEREYWRTTQNFFNDQFYGSGDVSRPFG